MPLTLLQSPSESPAHHDLTKRALDIHIDHYGGKRLPYVCVSASGLVQQFVRLEGPDAGTELSVMDASGGYASACLGAGHPEIVRAVIKAVQKDGYVTDEIASTVSAAMMQSAPAAQKAGR